MQTSANGPGSTVSAVSAMDEAKPLVQCIGTVMVKSESEPTMTYMTSDGENYVLASVAPSSKLYSPDGATSQSLTVLQPYATTYIVSSHESGDGEQQHLQLVGNTGGVQVSVQPSYGQPIAVPVTMENMEMPVQTVEDNVETITLDHVPAEPKIEPAVKVEPSELEQTMIESSSNSSSSGGGADFVRVVVGNTEKVDRTPIWRRKSPVKNRFMVSNPIRTESASSKPFYFNRRNRVIIDVIKNIPVAEFKSQLNDTSDIVSSIEVAPSSKKMLKYLTTGGVGKLFAYPGRSIPAKSLFKQYERHLTSKPQGDDNVEGDQIDLQPLGFQPENISRPRPITRKRIYPEAEEYKRRLQELQNNRSREGQTGEDYSNLQILIEAAESSPGNFHPLSKKAVMRVYPSRKTRIKKECTMKKDTRIIVIEGKGEDSGADGTSLQQNIEVLLAAAESDDDKGSIQRVIICKNGRGSSKHLAGDNKEQVAVE